MGLNVRLFKMKSSLNIYLHLPSNEFHNYEWGTSPFMKYPELQQTN